MTFPKRDEGENIAKIEQENGAKKMKKNEGGDSTETQADQVTKAASAGRQQTAGVRKVARSPAVNLDGV